MMNKDTNFYTEAVEFLKSVLPDDYEQRLTDLCKDKGWNRNEVLLFREFIKTRIDSFGMLVQVKHFYE